MTKAWGHTHIPKATMSTWTQGLHLGGVGRSDLKWWIVSGEEWFGVTYLVFRQPPEKWLTHCIAPKLKGRGIFLMVWGCFWGWNCGTYCPLIVKSVNKGVYVQLLEFILLPVLERVHHTLGDPILQQVNAPVHKATVVMDFFENYNIQVEDWPLYSPDLNPIEYVWVVPKHRLHRKYPDFRNTKEGPGKVNTRWAGVLTEIWEEIWVAYFEKLWKSISNRVAAVIDAKGWYTRYWACNSICFFFLLIQTSLYVSRYCVFLVWKLYHLSLWCNIDVCCWRVCSWGGTLTESPRLLGRDCIVPCKYSTVNATVNNGLSKF